jgi:type VI secretion system protein ImpK
MPDKDDPFFDMDDDRTVIKPNPGGRQKAARRRPEPKQDPDQKIELSARPGLNSLEKSASVLLNLLSQIRNTSSHPNPSDLHKQLANEIQRFEAGAQHEGLAPETIFIARYALCTTIDEFVMSTPWGSGSIWSKQSLLSMFHKETHGGERFFQMLKKLGQDPSRNIDLLELLYVCLALGFQGRYRVSRDGMNELAEIRENLYHTIRNQREVSEQALSPNWEGLKKSATAKAPLIPAWLAASIIILLLVGIFSLWRLGLGGYADPVHAGLMNLGREESLLPTRLLAPPAPLNIPDPTPPRFALREFLSAEISEGKVSVTELPDRIVISIPGDHLFSSGNEIIDSEYHEIIRRIGEGLEQTSGRIMVIGHSDNVPLRSNRRFGSNIELSQGRAESVVRLLQEMVSKPGRMVAEGLGDTRPIAPNTDAKGRAKNRRVEIILLERSHGS